MCNYGGKAIINKQNLNKTFLQLQQLFSIIILQIVVLKTETFLGLFFFTAYKTTVTIHVCHSFNQKGSLNYIKLAWVY